MSVANDNGAPRFRGDSAGDASSRERRLARLDGMARLLDTRFRIPGIGLRVGWDSILGLVPGIGDLVTVGPGAYMIVEAARMGARRRVLARMALNTGTDALLGSIPLLGDIFDAFFKSHRRNIAMLRSEVARMAPPAVPGVSFAGSRGAVDRVG